MGGPVRMLLDYPCVFKWANGLLVSGLGGPS